MSFPVIHSTSIALLGILFAIQVRYPMSGKVKKIARFFFYGSAVLIAVFLVYYSYLQYVTWQSHEFSKLFFENGIGYFLRYVQTRFWNQYVVSFVVSLIFLYAAKWYNRKHNEQFFHSEEPYLLALGMFLSGHPLWIAYFFLVIIVYAIITAAVSHHYGRVSFYYGWLPTALFVILMKSVIINVPFLFELIFSARQLIL